MKTIVRGCSENITVVTEEYLYKVVLDSLKQWSGNDYAKSYTHDARNILEDVKNHDTECRKSNARSH